MSKLLIELINYLAKYPLLFTKDQYETLKKFINREKEMYFYSLYIILFIYILCTYLRYRNNSVNSLAFVEDAVVCPCC